MPSPDFGFQPRSDNTRFLSILHVHGVRVLLLILHETRSAEQSSRLTVCTDFDTQSTDKTTPRHISLLKSAMGIFYRLASAC
jgi:hypothetical protein